MSSSKEKGTCSYPVIIMIPKQYDKSEAGYLCGEVISDNVLKSTLFIIHGVNDNPICDPYDAGLIGTIGEVKYPIKKRKKKENWVKLTIENNVPYVLQLVSGYVESKEVACQIVIYDKTRFLKSELISQLDSDSEMDRDEDLFNDHFKLLDYSLKHTKCSLRTPRDLPAVVKFILIKFKFCFTLLDNILSQFHFLVKISSLINHVYMFVKSAIWGLEYVMRKKRYKSLKIGNYILGLTGDWFGGMLLIFWILSIVSVEEVLQTLAVQSEVVVVALRNTVEYLMGSPADLKLNGPLNNVLGQFFLFHIDLWWAFLGFSRPLLELGFRLFICLGSLGLSFQLAILTDLLTIATFHIYIIYVYAAKLYHAQVSGLGTLSRVFLGRKRNPLPGRVDSCPYSTEQLLIGTIAFTVLLFLLPTTLVYYIVFTVMRLIIIAVAGLVMQASFVLRALPLYSILLWMCNSPTTASHVKLRPKQCTPRQCVLEACPVQGPWWPTVQSGSPFRPTPSSVPWRELCCHLLTGTLLYPV